MFLVCSFMAVIKTPRLSKVTRKRIFKGHPNKNMSTKRKKRGREKKGEEIILNKEKKQGIMATIDSSPLSSIPAPPEPSSLFMGLFETHNQTVDKKVVAKLLDDLSLSSKGVDPDEPKDGGLAPNPSIHLKSFHALWSAEVKELDNCYKYTIPVMGDAALTLGSSYRITKGMLTVLWLLYTMDGLEKKIYVRIPQPLILFASKDAAGAAGEVVLAARGKTGQDMKSEFLASLAEHKALATKIALNVTELAEEQKKQAEKKRVEEQLLAQEQALQEAKVRNDPTCEFDDFSFSNTGIWLPQNINRSDWYKSLNRIEAPASVAGTKEESPEARKARLNAEGKQIFVRDNIFGQIFNYVRLLVKNFRFVVSVIVKDGKKETVKLHPTVLVLNDVQRAFETNFDEIYLQKGVLVHAYPLQITNADILWLQKPLSEHLPVLAPQYFAFFAHMTLHNDKYSFHKALVQVKKQDPEDDAAIQEACQNFYDEFNTVVKSQRGAATASTVAPAAKPVKRVAPASQAAAALTQPKASALPKLPALPQAPESLASFLPQAPSQVAHAQTVVKEDLF